MGAENLTMNDIIEGIMQTNIGRVNFFLHTYTHQVGSSTSSWGNSQVLSGNILTALSELWRFLSLSAAHILLKVTMKTKTYIFLQPTTYFMCIFYVWGHCSVASSIVEKRNCLYFNLPSTYTAEYAIGRSPDEQPEVFYAAVDYKANKEDEVSVVKGEKVEVLNKSPLGWWTIRSVNT